MGNEVTVPGLWLAPADKPSQYCLSHLSVMFQPFPCFAFQSFGCFGAQNLKLLISHTYNDSYTRLWLKRRTKIIMYISNEEIR